MSDLARILNELGVRPRPVPAPPAPAPRPDPSKATGTWYRNDEDVPF